MLFMYIGTHPVDKCMADKPQEGLKLFSQVQEELKKAGVKTLGMYVAGHEHTTFAIFDANDILALERALVPFTMFGNARLIPVVSMEGRKA